MEHQNKLREQQDVFLNGIQKLQHYQQMTEDEIKEMQETNNAFVASLTPEVFNNSRISLVD